MTVTQIVLPHRRDNDDTHDSRYPTRDEYLGVVPSTPLDEGDFIVGGDAGTPTKLAIGSARQELAVVGGVPAWRNKSVFDVRDFGATGDGTTNDTVAIQAAIDAAFAGLGGTVVFPPGNYRCVGLVLKSGVVLQGQQRFRHSSMTKYGVRLTQFGAGIVIDTPTGSACDGAEINGLQIIGLGNGTAGVGIRFRDANFCAVKNVTLHGFQDEGVLVDSTSIACVFEDILTTQCLMDRSRAAKAGAMDIHGTDHQFLRVEAGCSSSSLSDSNAYICAWVIRGSQMGFQNCFGELSDIGFHFLVGASGNRLTVCRADLNFAHGWEVNGSLNILSSCVGLSNGQEANDTYDNFRFTNLSIGNLTIGCLSTSVTANKPKYGFNDLVTSDSGRNFHANPRSFLAVTAQYFCSSSSGSAFSFPSGSQRTLTANSTTPDVTGYERFITANSNPTTITNFAGGVEGQRILVWCNDANTTIQTDGISITLSHLSNLKLISGRIYEFVHMGGVWKDVNTSEDQVSADVGNAAKTLLWRRSESTQQWNTALTADRAVTLSTTGAVSGAKFRIVRTAAATGAFNLNVGTGPLKALAAGQWCDVEYTGSAWMLTAFGSL